IVRPLTGWLGDRQSKQMIGAVGVLLGAAGIAVLTYGDSGLTALMLFAFLFSFGDGINSVTWALVGDFFGRSHFATIRGWISMIQSIASIPAAVFTGWMYDTTQSYTYALIPFIVSYCIAGLIICRIPQPERPARRKVAAPAAAVIDRGRQPGRWRPPPRASSRAATPRPDGSGRRTRSDQISFLSETSKPMMSAQNAVLRSMSLTVNTT